MPAAFTPNPRNNEQEYKAMSRDEIKEALNRGRFKLGSALVFTLLISIGVLGELEGTEQEMKDLGATWDWTYADLYPLGF